MFGGGIDHVPLVDERGHLVAVAINRATSSGSAGTSSTRTARPS